MNLIFKRGGILMQQCTRLTTVMDGWHRLREDVSARTWNCDLIKSFMSLSIPQFCRSAITFFFFFFTDPTFNAIKWRSWRKQTELNLQSAAEINGLSGSRGNKGVGFPFTRQHRHYRTRFASHSEAKRDSFLIVIIKHGLANEAVWQKQISVTDNSHLSSPGKTRWQSLVL